LKLSVGAYWKRRFNEKRKLTVYAASGNKYAYVPQIILQGKWLEAIGFSIGDKVTQEIIE